MTDHAIHFDASAPLEPLEPRCLMAGVPYGADFRDTSEYMLGSIAVNVVLMESTGATDTQTENWTATEISQVKGEITAGLQWWEDTYALKFPNAQTPLHFRPDFTHADSPVLTGYEPITRTRADQTLWQDDFLNRVGFNTSDTTKNDLYRYAHDTRQRMGTDWAFNIFVVDSSLDADGKFSDGSFAFVTGLGGPSVVMTYDNNGWGIGRMEMVVAHETAHVFYALDEYAGSGRTYTTWSGYLGVQNLNAADGHPNPSSRVISLMAEGSLQQQAYAAHTSSPSSLEMLGWRDTDADGIMDILDQPPTLTGTGSTASGVFTFTGTAQAGRLANLNPFGQRHNITLNTVSAFQYRIDGGNWITARTLSTGSASVSLTLTVPTGAQRVELRSVDVWAKPSNVLGYAVTSVTPTPPPEPEPPTKPGKGHGRNKDRAPLNEFKHATRMSLTEIEGGGV